MIRPAYAVLFQQGIDEFNRRNFEDVADATLYSWYNGHAANPQLRTVTAVAHVLGFDPTLVPRKSADRRRYLHAVA